MTPHDCHAHVDNQGCCHTCGRPANPDGWIAHYGGTYEDYAKAEMAFAEAHGPLPLSSPYPDAMRRNRARIRWAVAALSNVSHSMSLRPGQATPEGAMAVEALADTLEAALEAWRRREGAS